MPIDTNEDGPSLTRPYGIKLSSNAYKGEHWYSSKEARDRAAAFYLEPISGIKYTVAKVEYKH